MPAATPLTFMHAHACTPARAHAAHPSPSLTPSRPLSTPSRSLLNRITILLFPSQGFDPLNLSEVADLKWMREAELKHGRVCMLAWAGYVAVDLGWVAPGAPKGISSLAAHDVTVKSGQMLLLLGTVGVFEALTYNAVSEMMKSETDRAPGDFGLDPFSWAKANPTRMQTAELLHGRTAMLAFSGVVTQSALKGVCFPYF